MKINERIYSDAEIKLIKEIFDMYIERIYDEDLGDLINQCKELFLDNQRLMKENKRLNNIVKDIKSQLDYLETYSSNEDVFEDMKRRLGRIDKIIGSDKE